MGLSNELSCEAGRFSCCLNARTFFQSEVLRLYFPMLEPWVVHLSCSTVIPPHLSTCKCGTTGLPATTSWDPPGTPCWPAAALPTLLHLTGSSSHHLAGSPLSPSESLCPSYRCGRMFLLHSLVVALPYSSIFWQFWLFFAF